MAGPQKEISIVPIDPPKEPPYANATHVFFGPTPNEATLTFMRIPPTTLDVSSGQVSVPVVSAVTMPINVVAGLAQSILENLPAVVSRPILEKLVEIVKQKS